MPPVVANEPERPAECRKLCQNRSRHACNAFSVGSAEQPRGLAPERYFACMTLLQAQGRSKNWSASSGSQKPLSRRFGTAVIAVVFLVAACGSDTSTDEPASDEPVSESATTVAPDGGDSSSGGTLVLAVEQWPECINPVTSCANATWTIWSVLIHYLPRLMELDQSNTYVASSLLVEEPTVANGGLVTADDGTFTLTYRLNPDATWSDGEPITSTDVWFSWRAGLDTTGKLSTIGLDLITEIDPCRSPHGRHHVQRAVCTVADAVRRLAAGARAGSRHRYRRQVERRDHRLGWGRGSKKNGIRSSTSWCPIARTGTPSASRWWTVW